MTVLLDLAQAILRSLLLSPHGSLLAGKLSLPVNILHCLHNAVHSLVANSVDGCVLLARLELTDTLSHLLVILYSAVMPSLSSRVDVAFSLLVLGASGFTLLLLDLLLFESGSLGHLHQLAAVHFLFLTFLAFYLTLLLDCCLLLAASRLLHLLSALPLGTTVLICFLLGFFAPLDDLHLRHDTVAVFDSGVLQGLLVVLLLFGSLDSLLVLLMTLLYILELFFLCAKAVLLLLFQARDLLVFLAGTVLCRLL